MCRGSVIAKIVGTNVRGKPKLFDERVSMYVYEEVVDGTKLTEIINSRHENVKYLPGCIIPHNVVGDFVVWILISFQEALLVSRLLPSLHY